MIVFCTLGTLLFQVLAIANLRRGFYVYLACLPVLPAYIAIPLVKGGAGISLIRMMTYALAVAIVMTILRNPMRWIPVFRRINKWPGFLFWLGTFYLAKLLSTAIYQDAIALVYWLDEFVGVVVIFLLAVRYITSIDELKKIFVILLPVLFVQQAIVAVEVLMNHPILQGVVEVNVSTVGMKVAEGYEREGAYRAIGLFENPLSLAEYLLVGVAMMFGAYGTGVVSRWLSFSVGLLFLFVSMSFTGARYSVIAFGLSLVFAGLFYYGYRLSYRARPVFLIVVVFLLSSGAYFAYLLITDVYWFLGISSDYLGGGVDATASVISRATQYLIVPADIFGNATNGLLGAGMQSDLIERLDVKLDNHYLRILIEGGLIGVISFFVLLVIPFSYAASLSNYNNISRLHVRGVRLFFLLFFSLFAINKLFLSMSFNNYYFFLFSGVVLSLLSSDAGSKKYRGKFAHPTCT